jgi:hypothetical protein
MSFISLTQACHLLAIDVKTLHRWLAQAQLSLHAHPGDGRLKGLTSDQLLLVATAHHRRLPALPQEPPALAHPCPPAESPAPPADLLTLLQPLRDLPAQIAALQAQLAALTALLPAPAVTASLVQQDDVLEDAPTPTPPPAIASVPKRPAAHVIALVEYVSEGSYVVICPQQGLLTFKPDSPAWFAWLATRSSFRFLGPQGRLTAHREVERVPGVSWRAHRRIRNHTYNLHLGATEALTLAVLERAAADLQAYLV